MEIKSQKPENLNAFPIPKDAANINHKYAYNYVLKC